MLKLIRSYIACKDAATANHIGGWAGTAVAGVCGWLVASGTVEQVRTFVCNASQNDLGLAVATIGVAASLINTGSTKALTRRQDAQDAQTDINVALSQPTPPINSDLERVKQPFPKPKRR